MAWMSPAEGGHIIRRKVTRQETGLDEVCLFSSPESSEPKSPPSEPVSLISPTSALQHALDDLTSEQRERIEQVLQRAEASRKEARVAVDTRRLARKGITHKILREKASFDQEQAGEAALEVSMSETASPSHRISPRRMLSERADSIVAIGENLEREASATATKIVSRVRVLTAQLTHWFSQIDEDGDLLAFMNLGQSKSPMVLEAEADSWADDLACSIVAAALSKYYQSLLLPSTFEEFCRRLVEDIFELVYSQIVVTELEDEEIKRLDEICERLVTEVLDAAIASDMIKHSETDEELALFYELRKVHVSRSFECAEELEKMLEMCERIEPEAENGKHVWDGLEIVDADYSHFPASTASTSSAIPFAYSVMEEEVDDVPDGCSVILSASNSSLSSGSRPVSVINRYEWMEWMKREKEEPKTPTIHSIDHHSSPSTSEFALKMMKLEEELYQDIMITRIERSLSPPKRFQSEFFVDIIERELERELEYDEEELISYEATDYIVPMIAYSKTLEELLERAKMIDLNRHQPPPRPKPPSWTQTKLREVEEKRKEEYNALRKVSEVEEEASEEESSSETDFGEILERDIFYERLEEEKDFIKPSSSSEEELENEQVYERLDEMSALNSQRFVPSLMSGVDSEKSSLFEENLAEVDVSSSTVQSTAQSMEIKLVQAEVSAQIPELLEELKVYTRIWMATAFGEEVCFKSSTSQPILLIASTSDDDNDQLLKQESLELFPKSVDDVIRQETTFLEVEKSEEVSLVKPEIPNIIPALMLNAERAEREITSSIVTTTCFGENLSFQLNSLPILSREDSKTFTASSSTSGADRERSFEQGSFEILVSPVEDINFVDAMTLELQKSEKVELIKAETPSLISPTMAQELEMTTRIVTATYFGEEVREEPSTSVLIREDSETFTASSSTSGADQEQSFEKESFEQVQERIDANTFVNTMTTIIQKSDQIQLAMAEVPSLIPPLIVDDVKAVSRIQTVTYFGEDVTLGKPSTSQPVLVKEESEISIASSATSGADQSFEQESFDLQESLEDSTFVNVITLELQKSEEVELIKAEIPSLISPTMAQELEMKTRIVTATYFGEEVREEPSTSVLFREDSETFTASSSTSGADQDQSFEQESFELENPQEQVKDIVLRDRINTDLLASHRLLTPEIPGVIPPELIEEQEISSRIETVTYFGEEVALESSQTSQKLLRKESFASSSTSGADDERSFDQEQEIQAQEQVEDEILRDRPNIKMIRFTEVLLTKAERVEPISPDISSEVEIASRIESVTYFSEDLGQSAQASQELLRKESFASSSTSGADDERSFERESFELENPHEQVKDIVLRDRINTDLLASHRLLTSEIPGVIPPELIEEQEISSRIETVTYFGEEVTLESCQTSQELLRKESFASSSTSGADQDQSFEKELFEQVQEPIDDNTFVNTMTTIVQKSDQIQLAMAEVPSLIPPLIIDDFKAVSRIQTVTYFGEDVTLGKPSTSQRASSHGANVKGIRLKNTE
ncbi:unnamed protein product, partial [Mesorhabditis belari]|uniref:Uncharacterized protein n=1 Tax=Mesorhabditis belari TaxID=2138241 RepID=A0AAF3FM22_9BILA